VHKEKLNELVEDWKTYARETGVVGLTPELADIVAQDGMEDPSRWMRIETAGMLAKAVGVTTKIE